MGERHPLGRIAGFRIEQRHGHPVGHDVEHRNPDIGALAGAAARNQRFEDGGMRGGAGRDIDDGNADPRRPFRAAGDRGEPALGLDQQVIGLAIGVGAVVAIARNGAADQRRIVLAQAVPAKSRACPSSRVSGSAAARPRRRSALPASARPSLVARSIDHRILAAVEPDEIAALALRRGVIAAGEIALGTFDLDHMRAGIRQPRGAEWRGDRLFDGDDDQVLRAAAWRVTQ